MYSGMERGSPNTGPGALGNMYGGQGGASQDTGLEGLRKM